MVWQWSQLTLCVAENDSTQAEDAAFRDLSQIHMQAR